MTYTAAREGVLSGAICHSPLGPIEILAGSRGLRLIEFLPAGNPPKTQSVAAGSAGILPAPARRRPPKAEENELSDTKTAQAIVEQAIRELVEYFDGRRRAFEVPLDLNGAPFQMAVWRALLRLGYGKTITYRELAAAAGRPAAIRAAGAANGANPIAIVVPCHRVVGSNGSLTGYAGGLAAKRFLLDLEQATSNR